MSASIRSLQDDASESAYVNESSSTIFGFEDFFLGHTYASGWFADRFSKPRRHFCGHFYGHYDGSTFLLDEALHYSDGYIDERQWSVSVSDDGKFSAESSSLINGATGQITGNTLFMQYSMKIRIEEGKTWALDMKDRMILQPDGILHNITQVSKWGVRIGTVSAQYHRMGDSRLLTRPDGVPAAGKTSPLRRHLHEAKSR